MLKTHDQHGITITEEPFLILSLTIHYTHRASLVSHYTSKVLCVNLYCPSLFTPLYATPGSFGPGNSNDNNKAGRGVFLNHLGPMDPRVAVKVNQVTGKVV